MKGCYVYCTNEPLAEHLKQSMGSVEYGFVRMT